MKITQCPDAEEIQRKLYMCEKTLTIFFKILRESFSGLSVQAKLLFHLMSSLSEKFEYLLNFHQN